MGHVRSAIYHHLIKAENIAQRQQFGTNAWQRYEFTDFDRDSQDELIIEGDQQNLYIDPHRGGTIFEWDMRRSMHNLLSVMTRREEGYHQTLREYEQERRRHAAALAKAAQSESSAESTSAEPLSPHTTVRTKEPNLDAYLVVDPYRRNSLIDHFLAPSVTLAHFAQQLFEEQGNFVELPYQSEVQQDEHGITVMLYRDGYVRRAGALSSIPVRVSKRLFLPRGEERLVIRYIIENKGQTRLFTQFASEWNINLLGGGNNDQAYYRIEGDEGTIHPGGAINRAPMQGVIQDYFDTTGEDFQVRAFSIGNRWLEQDVAFRLSEAATLWRFSIETVTGSEAGFERTHQGSCLTLVWSLELEAGQSWSVGIECIGSPAGTSDSL
jgi:alpha-amylase